MNKRLRAVAAAVATAATVVAMVGPAAPPASATGGSHDGATAYLALSRFADRSDAVALEGAQVTSDDQLAIFLAPLDRWARRVAFSLNGRYLRTEHHRPYDMAGTRAGRAVLVPASSALLRDGDNTVTARVVLGRGRSFSVSATFTRVDEAPTIAQIAAADARLSTLVDALDLASAAGPVDLAAAVSDPEADLTVFAPTNAAFSALGPLLAEALADPAGRLSELLAHHVVGESLDATRLVDAGRATTLLGADVTIAVDGDAIVVDGAVVIAADIEAANGIVHVIDAVLLPPAPSQPGTIAGIVLDQLNRPVPGAKANLYALAPDGTQGVFLGRADASNGTYGYRVDPGCYLVVLIAPDGFVWDRNGGRFISGQRCVTPGETVFFDGTLVAIVPPS